MYVCVDAMERGIQVFCVKRILACFVAFVGVLFMAVGGANANVAGDAYFYYRNGNVILQRSDNANAFRVQSTYCARDSSGSVYGCNGGCMTLGATDVPPNGSYFVTSSSSGATTYVCTTNGWVSCEKNPSYPSEMKNELPVILYKSDDGYRNFTVEFGYIVHDIDTFCAMPYEYLNGKSHTIGVFYDGVVPDDFTNNYAGCAAGRYLSSGKNCESCGSIENGEYNIEEWHTKDYCEITCVGDYMLQGSICVERDRSKYDICKYDESYDGGNIGKCEDDGSVYLKCPSEATCDGTYVFCDPGAYPYYVDGGVICKLCPSAEAEGVGMAMVIADYITADNDQKCEVGDSQEYGYAKALGTVGGLCNYVGGSNGTNLDDTYCYVFKGADTTGSYVYRNPEDGYWLGCEYKE